MERMLLTGLGGAGAVGERGWEMTESCAWLLLLALLPRSVRDAG